MRWTRTLALACTLGLLSAGASGAAWKEAPMLAARAAKGEIPPVGERLPAHPRVIDVAKMGREPGRYGGDLRVLMARSKDTRIMVVYGYARLVVYDTNYKLIPDILESVDVRQGRIFTFKLRAGHRWSDGHPFTTEDFRYYWEDIANNKDLAPFGPPQILLVDGKAPRFEVLDERTVRYTWAKPNPFFLPALAGARPQPIFAPAHYLKQFHARYTDPAKLAALAKEEGQRNWAAVHIRRFRPYKNNNPDLPSLQPWINTTFPPAQRFVFVRNPYFHRVDERGRQLPYIDRVLMNIADGKLIAAKSGAGESDLQARNLSFNDYAFLRQNTERVGIRVLLWKTTKGAHLALYPNLNVSDPQLRRLARDVRFRRALSLAIDRDEINDVIYFGLAQPGNDTVVAGGPLYKPEYQHKWAEFDLDRANRLLDEVGLKKRDDDGVRLLPDGRPLSIIVETAGEDTEQTDVLELIADSWIRAGIKLFSKPLQREVFRNRIYSGQTFMSIWGGLENGLPTADMSPHELAPTAQDQLQWPKWGQYAETGGHAGEAPDLPAAQELARLNAQWTASSDHATREKIWERMLTIRMNRMYTIGLISGVPQPVVISKRLHNVPEKGIYNWDPGAHFGVYMPDTFWLAAH